MLIEIRYVSLFANLPSHAPTLLHTLPTVALTYKPSILLHALLGRRRAVYHTIHVRDLCHGIVVTVRRGLGQGRVRLM